MSANAFAAPAPVNLSKDQAKDALNQTIELLKLPENVTKMDMAKAQMAAQPDNIMMLMMLVLPVATEVCMPVLTKFGFQGDQGGLMEYMKAVMAHKDDAEISALGKEMRNTFVPEALSEVVGMMLSGGPMGAM